MVLNDTFLGFLGYIHFKFPSNIRQFKLLWLNILKENIGSFCLNSRIHFVKQYLLYVRYFVNIDLEVICFESQ